jgi:hypothetical protein
MQAQLHMRLVCAGLRELSIDFMICFTAYLAACSTTALSIMSNGYIMLATEPLLPSCLPCSGLVAIELRARHSAAGIRTHVKLAFIASADHLASLCALCCSGLTATQLRSRRSAAGRSTAQWPGLAQALPTILRVSSTKR